MHSIVTNILLQSLSIIAGVIVGQMLVRAFRTLAHRTGFADRIEQRAIAVLDSCQSTAVSVARNEATWMLVWALLTIGIGTAFILGMKV